MKLQRFLKHTAALMIVLVLMCPYFSALAANYATLEFGSRGNAVLDLQKALTALGYDTNGVDGKFGRGTETAVKKYQKDMGLVVDGKAGNRTLSMLYASGGSSGSSSGTSSGSTSSGNSSMVTPDVTAGLATSTNPNTIKYGDSGSRVRELQTALKLLGYNPGIIDGKFGAGTLSAVMAFQRDNGLTADGLAGSQTQNLLFSKAAQSGSTSGSTGSSSSSSSSSSGGNAAGLTRTLRRGYSGADVKEVQNRLKALGYYKLNVDGVYGNGTIAAVKEFQKKNNLTADGLVGKQTYAVLFGSSANANIGSSTGSSSSGSSSSSSSSNSAGSSASGSEESVLYPTLSYGSSGSSVKKLQQALKDLEYNVGVDGQYGALTQSAVRAFQKQNGLTADGVAGSKTQEILYSGKGKKADPNADDDMAIPEGTGSASGPSTSSVKLLHWFNDIKPTLKSGERLLVFDPATNLQWTLRVYSRGRHCDSEPLTATDTRIMYKAFGNKNSWGPKPVYVKLPDGRWTVASTHNVPHESQSIKDNDFDGHLCVHFLRDMEEAKKNDPNYGVQNQNAIRKKWKEMTGITVN